MNSKNLKRFIQNELYWRFLNYRFINIRNLYRDFEQNHLRRLLSSYDVDCVFDVGANYGQYAEMLRRKANFRGLIISFEPIPAAAAILRYKSRSDKSWIIEEIALSGSSGEQVFNIMNSSQFSSLNKPRHDKTRLFESENTVGEEISVKVETLDAAYQRLKMEYKFSNPFLKMDTQGCDVQIVSNSISALKQFVGLQSELAIKKLYENSVDFRDALTIYEDCGFSLSAFVPNNAGHFPLLIETDCIMIRNDLAND